MSSWPASEDIWRISYLESLESLWKPRVSFCSSKVDSWYHFLKDGIVSKGNCRAFFGHPNIIPVWASNEPENLSHNPPLQQQIQLNNWITFEIPQHDNAIVLEQHQQISDFPKPTPPSTPTLNQEIRGKTPRNGAFRVKVEAFQARPAVKWLHTAASNIISYHYPFPLRPSNQPIVLSGESHAHTFYFLHFSLPCKVSNLWKNAWQFQ